MRPLPSFLALLLLVLTAPCRAMPPEDFADALARAGDLPPASACDALEELLRSRLDEDQRRDTIRALLRVLPGGAPPISPTERAMLDAARADCDAQVSEITGRYLIVLATEPFARRAAENGFLAQMDLAHLMLRDLFRVDPVRVLGHRYIVYPQRGRAGGHSINAPTLRIFIGDADRDNADRFERFIHEMSHAFMWMSPANHMDAGGFAEGWAEFCQAYVSQRLAFLGPPWEGRYEWYAEHFPREGFDQHLRNRLPIEEIIGYDPSAGLLMELLLSTRHNPGTGRPPLRDIDWSPFRDIFADALASRPDAPIRDPGADWPVLMAREFVSRFGDNALPILAHYRFPLHKVLGTPDPPDAGYGSRDTRIDPRAVLIESARLRYTATSRTPPDDLLDQLVLALRNRSPDIRRIAAWAIAGHRELERAPTELSAAWRRERNTLVAESLKSAFEELLARPVDSPAMAAELVRRTRYMDCRYVEAEQAVHDGDHRGGWYGSNPGALGGLCLGRDFGTRPDDIARFNVDLRRGMRYVIRIRYACPDGARLSLRLRHVGVPRFESIGINLPRTDSWTDWRWLDIPAPNLDAGAYQLDLFDVSGSPDIDIVGLCPPGHF